MKQTFYLKIVGAIFLFFTTITLNAQIVGDDAFLQGNYVELGVNHNGTYVSDVAPPEGYHNNVDGYFGLVIDTDKDGWTEGTPNYCGDYFAPGSPEEGFIIEFGDKSYHNTWNGLPTDISGSIVSYTSTPSYSSTVWEGAIKNLTVTQTTVVLVNKTFVSTRIILTNTGDMPLTDVYYTRNTDPDNEAEIDSEFITNNIVVYNHPVDEWSLVEAKA
jgi:hypothetical protein